MTSHVGADPHLGRTLGGQYRIEALLGCGGMGRVYRGLQLSVNRPVAIKLITGTAPHPPEWVRRFQREAEATARLSHPNSVRLFDFGVTEAAELYMVMELLEGNDLARQLGDHGPLILPDALSIARQVLLALSEAHALGIVHRDIKPDNVFLARVHGGDLVAKVMDFGIAGLDARSHSPKLTGTGVVIGTPTYMSPEQAQGLPVDASSDVYSLGVVLFEMLSGRPVFESDTAMNLLLAHISQPPRRLSAVGVKVPHQHGVQTLLDGMLAKDAQARPSVQEALEAVAALSTGHVRAGTLITGAGSLQPRASPHLSQSVSIAGSTGGREAAAVRVPSGTGIPTQRAPSGTSTPPERTRSSERGAPASRATPAANPELERDEVALSRHERATPGASRPASAPTPGSGIHASQILVPKHRLGRRWALPALAALLLLAAAGALALRQEPEEHSHAASPAQPSQPAPPPGLHAVTIRSEPSGATIHLNGMKLGTTPYVFHFQDAAELRLSRRGYERQTVKVTPDGEATLEVKLEREPTFSLRPRPPEVPVPAGSDNDSKGSNHESWVSTQIAELRAEPPEVPDAPPAPPPLIATGDRAAARVPAPYVPTPQTPVPLEEPPRGSATGASALQTDRSAATVPASAAQPGRPSAQPSAEASHPPASSSSERPPILDLRRPELNGRPEVTRRSEPAARPLASTSSDDDEEVERAARHHTAKTFVRVFARALGKLLIPDPPRERRAALADEPLLYKSFGSAHYAYKHGDIDRSEFQEAVWQLRQRRRHKIIVERENLARGAISKGQYDARVDRVWSEFWGN